MAKSRRPYLIRAVYDWAADNGYTPHLLISADAEGVIVPREYVSEGRITLNISPMAEQNLDLRHDPIRFFARFSDATHLQFDLRAADTYAEVAQGFDSRRYSAAAVLQHDLNPTSNVSLHLAGTRVDFDDEVTSVDYTRQDGFGRYEGNRRKVEYQLDLGRSRLDRRSADDVSTALVDWGRQLVKRRR